MHKRVQKYFILDLASSQPAQLLWRVYCGGIMQSTFNMQSGADCCCLEVVLFDAAAFLKKRIHGTYIYWYYRKNFCANNLNSI